MCIRDSHTEVVIRVSNGPVVTPDPDPDPEPPDNPDTPSGGDGQNGTGENTNA